MKIALVQRAANVERGLATVRASAEEGAKLVAFAELAFDRFRPQCRCVGDRLELAEPIPGPTTSRVAESHARRLFLRDRRPELYRRWFA